MKNIFQILEKHSITVPKEDQKEITKEIAEQYKPIAEVESLQGKIENLTAENKNLQEKYDTDISKRDEDLKNLKEQVENSGADAEKLKSVTDELDKMKETYASDKKEWEDTLSKQKYEFAVKEKVNGLRFTSNAAKKAFVQDVIAEDLKLKDDELLGFDDFVEKYQAEDEGVFVKEQKEDKGDGDDGKQPPKFTGPRGKGDDDDGSEGGEESGAADRPLIW